MKRSYVPHRKYPPLLRTLPVQNSNRKLLTFGGAEFESCQMLWLVNHVLLEVIGFEKYLIKLTINWLGGRGIISYSKS